MSERIKLVYGDTGPQIKLSFTDEITGLPSNLTGATVTLHFRAVDTDTILFSRVALMTDAVQGICIIDWEPGDLDQDAGDYEGEVEVIRANGTKETLYDLLRFRIREAFA